MMSPREANPQPLRFGLSLLVRTHVIDYFSILGGFRDMQMSAQGGCVPLLRRNEERASKSMRPIHRRNDGWTTFRFDEKLVDLLAP